MAYPISDVTRRVVYSGSAGTGPYSFSFEVLANTDIAVYKNTTLLTLTTDYTVTINANGTGSVTLVSAATGSDNITLVGNRSIQRATDFVTGGDLFANSLNDEFDSLVIFSQQVKELANRGLKAPITDPTDVNMVLPVKASRKGKVLAFDSTTGDPVNGPALDAMTTVIAQSANINTVANNITNVNTVAGNTTNINTVAGISSNLTTVAGNSSNVTTVASNISSVNSAATNMAAIIAAPTQASNAASSASAAASSATSASNSAAAAAASAASGMYSSVQDKSSNYSVVAADAGDLIRVTTSGGAVTITLPQISSVSDGFKVAIVKWTGDTNSVTVARSGSDTINGSTSAAIGSQYTQITFVADFETNQWFAVTSGLGSTNVVVDAFSGNGSTTAFTLSGDPGTKNNTYVYVGGVYQQKSTYSLSVTTLTFSAAPPSGTSNIEVVWTQPLPVGTPSDGTVTAAKMAAGAAVGNLGFTPVNKAGDTLTGALNENTIATIASASSIDIGAATANTISITGTTAITALGTIAAGAVRRLVFSGALTLTHNATSLILPSGASITTAAGDVAEFVSLGSGNWRCFNYMKANGQAVVAPAAGVTSVATGNGLTGGTITTTGTISLDYYTGTSASNTSFPVGSYLLGYGGSTALASSSALYVQNISSGAIVWIGNPGAGYTILSGTWRARGIYTNCASSTLYQRTA